MSQKIKEEMINIMGKDSKINIYDLDHDIMHLYFEIKDNRDIKT